MTEIPEPYSQQYRTIQESTSDSPAVNAARERFANEQNRHLHVGKVAVAVAKDLAEGEHVSVPVFLNRVLRRSGGPIEDVQLAFTNLESVHFLKLDMLEGVSRDIWPPEALGFEEEEVD